MFTIKEQPMLQQAVKPLRALKSGLNLFGLAGLLVCLLAITGCGSGNQATPPSTATAQGQLYVAVPSTPGGDSAVYRFSDPSTLTGTATPMATLTGSLTQLHLPVVALDKTADRLFALVNPGPSTGAILVFDHASTKNGNVAPDRVISGSATALQALGAFVVDGTRNLIYAAASIDPDGHVDILVFRNASTLNGNVAPVAVLKFGVPGIGPSDMVLDEANDRLFVLNSASEIQVFDNASTLASGLMVPNRVISGPNVGLGVALHIALDPAGRLLVSNLAAPVASNSINIYANAATANGDVAPVAMISGSSTGLNVGGPGNLAVYSGPGASAGGDLYVSIELGKVLVFNNIAAANGNVLPARTFTVTTNFGGSELGLFADASR
jgi:hypothetical protein